MEDIIEQIMQQELQAARLYDKLCSTHSMTKIADMIDDMDETMAKLVLKKFVYAKKAEAI